MSEANRVLIVDDDQTVLDAVVMLVKAKILNLDNLRAPVQKADWYDPELNPKLLSFCRHYGCALLPCLPRVPEHKGKTERGIDYVKDNGLRGRTLPSLTAENEFLRTWE